MAKHIFVRPARPEDAEKHVAWSRSTPNNLFDPALAGYKSVMTLVAFDKNGPLVFMPAQRPIMLESLAIRPGADPVDVAVALKELTQAYVTTCFQVGADELYFLCQDDSTQTFAAKNGYEKLPWSVYRLKPADLEKP